MALIHPVEPFKDPCLMFLGNTNAGVLDCHAVLANGDGNLAAVLVIADGVVAQVVNQFIGKLADTRNDGIFTQQLYGDVPLICRREQGLQYLRTDGILVNTFLGELTAFIQLG